MAENQGTPVKAAPVGDRRVTVTGGIAAKDIGGGVLDGLELPIQRTSSNPVAIEMDEKGTPAPAAKPAETDPPTSNWEQRYKDLETKFGKQGTELGDLRKVTDGLLLQSQQPAPLQTTPVPATTPGMTDEEIEKQFVDHPAEAVRNIEKRATEATLRTIDQRSGHDRLLKAHPNWQQEVNSPEFHAWVRANVPQSQVDAANNDGDGTAWILSQFKESGKPAPGPTPPDPGNGDGKGAVPAVDKNTIATEIATKRRMVTQATGVGTDHQEGNLPEFTRLELAKMRLDEPLKYETMQDQIIQAYQDGRVK